MMSKKLCKNGGCGLKEGGGAVFALTLQRVGANTERSRKCERPKRHKTEKKLKTATA